MLIAIDAGHGLPDPGAVGPSGLRESAVTMLAAESLAGRLRELDHTAMLTRIGPGMPLWERTRVANKATAAAFVSIHCNAATNPAAHGSETLYYPGSVRGAELAQRLQQALVRVGGRRDRGLTERSGLHVLRRTDMPAALVELAFISNPEEEKLLADTDWVTRVARALGDAVHLWAQKGMP